MYIKLKIVPVTFTQPGLGYKCLCSGVEDVIVQNTLKSEHIPLMTTNIAYLHMKIQERETVGWVV